MHRVSRSICTVARGHRLFSNHGVPHRARPLLPLRRPLFTFSLSGNGSAAPRCLSPCLSPSPSLFPYLSVYLLFILFLSFWPEAAAPVDDAKSAGIFRPAACISLRNNATVSAPDNDKRVYVCTGRSFPRLDIKNRRFYLSPPVSLVVRLARGERDSSSTKNRDRDETKWRQDAADAGDHLAIRQIR